MNPNDNDVLYCPACGGEIGFDKFRTGWSTRGESQIILDGTYIQPQRCVECPNCGESLTLTANFLWDYSLENIEVEVDDEEAVQ